MIGMDKPKLDEIEPLDDVPDNLAYGKDKYNGFDCPMRAAGLAFADLSDREEKAALRLAVAFDTLIATDMSPYTGFISTDAAEEYWSKAVEQVTETGRDPEPEERVGKAVADAFGWDL